MFCWLKAGRADDGKNEGGKRGWGEGGGWAREGWLGEGGVVGRGRDRVGLEDGEGSHYFFFQKVSLAFHPAGP